jgi:amino acid transporter
VARTDQQCRGAHGSVALMAVFTIINVLGVRRLAESNKIAVL